MKYFLLIYDRRRGELLLEKEFIDHATALKARFQAEGEGVARGGVEVVVLGAESADALRRTHGRYFKTIGQLAKD